MIPDERSILCVKTVEMVIESAGQNLVVQNHRGGLHTVPALEFPNHAAIVLIEAIDIAVRGGKINAIVANRRLPRPRSSAPRIFVKPAAHETGLDFPHDLQLATFPGTRAIKISFGIPK